MANDLKGVRTKTIMKRKKYRLRFHSSLNNDLRLILFTYRMN